MLEFIQRHEDLVWWLAVLSVISLLASAILMPFLLVRVPVDYFSHPKRLRLGASGRPPALRLALRVLKNLVGALFLLAGVAMLVLPGQGILTMLAGLFLLDFPGKYAVERWLVRRPAVLRSINWLRQKLNSPPLAEPRD